MIKVIPSDSFDFGMPAASLLDVWSRGVDASYLQKRAAVLTREIEDIKPEAGHSFIHLISLGAYDYTGSNKNSDSWLEKAGSVDIPEPKDGRTKKVELGGGLMETHSTFKSGHVFKHHLNGHPNKAIGKIAAEAYNPTMHRGELVIKVENDHPDWKDELQKLANGRDIPFSMACFPPGTLVQLPSREEVCIETLLSGTKVLTHAGRVCEVTARMVRPYADDLVSFRPAGVPDEIKATLNHKIWVRPTLRGKQQRCPVCSKQFKSLRAHLRQQADAQHQLANKDYGRYAEGWVTAEQLAVGDFVRTPFVRTVSEGGCPTLATVLGYYLSEGSTFNYGRDTDRDYNKGVDFSFSSTEQVLVDKLCVALRTLGYTNIHVYKRKHNVLLVRVSSVKLYEEMLRLGGKYSWGKQIAAEVMRWAPETQMKLIGAFTDGDGHFCKIQHQLILTTVSRVLAWQLAELCWRNNMPAALLGYQSKQKNKRRAYTVKIPARCVSVVDTMKVPSDYAYQATANKPVGHLKHQVAGTTVAIVSRALMSYVERGFVYRRVTKVARTYYEGPVYNLTVADDHSYVVGGIAVSNCKLDADMCSWCGNRAKNRGEYCNHLRDHLSEITKTGHQIFAWNDDCRFFDISKVHRPADRIAYSLRKVANAEPGGLDLAEEFGIVSPTWLNDAVFVPTRNYRAKMAAARKLAEMEKLIDGVARAEDNPQVKALACGCPKDLDPDTMGQMKKLRLIEALEALGSAQICLSIKDFLQLVLPNQDTSADLPSVERKLPSMFSDLLSSDSLGECAADQSYDTQGSAIPSSIKSMLERLTGSCSMGEVPARRRISITIVGGDIPKLKERSKIASVDKRAEILTKEYAKYLLSYSTQTGCGELDRGLTVVRNRLTV